MTYQRTRVLISIAALLGALALSAWLPVDVRGASELRTCGQITGFVPASSVLPGAITVGGIPLVIAPGTSIAGVVQPGTTQCVDFDLDAGGQISGGTIRPDVTTTIQVCGVVSGFTAADADSAGSVTIDGQTFTLAPGSNVPGTATVSEDQCFTFSLNGLGQITDGTAWANVGSFAQLCGTITGLAASAADSAGSLTIGGQTFAVAPGSTLPATARVGEDQCMTLTLNGLGQITDATAQANVTSVAVVCGQVNGAVASSPTSSGSLTIDGAQQQVAPGTMLSPELAEGRFVTVRQTLDAFGRIVGTEVLDAGASLAEACGTGAPEPGPGAAAAPPDDGAVGIGISPMELIAELFGTLAGTAGPQPAPGQPAAPSEAGPSTGGDGAQAPAAPAAGGGGGFLPNTASLARAGAVVVVTGIPLLVMLIGLLGSMAWRHFTGSPGDDGLIG